MENNQMIPFNKNGMFYKIKRFFKNLFGKKEEIFEEKIAVEEPVIEEQKETVDIKGKFFNDIKVDNSNIDKLVNTKNLISRIDEDINVLKELSVEELTDIRDYYKEIIRQNELTIKKLQEE